MKNKGQQTHGRRHGLILLLALGMLALFSLLAVTYIVAASNSRAGAQAMKIRANTSTTTVISFADTIVKQAIRGTRDQKSVFYQHSLLEDVYGQHPIRGRFGHLLLGSVPPVPSYLPYFTGSSGIGPNPWCFQLQDETQTGHTFVKLSLFPKSESLYGDDPTTPPLSNSTAILSPFENAYTSRLITMLEGPLAGQSFRILKYVGYVRSGSGVSATRDPNYQFDVGLTIQDDPPNGREGADIDYSILVDLSDLDARDYSGVVYDFASANQIPFRGKAEQWLTFNIGLQNNGLQSLFYRRDTNGRPFGYAFVINDAAFNNPGIGLGDVDNVGSHNTAYGLGFGNLDARQVMAIPASPGFKRIPPALLPNYDYLQNTTYVNNITRSIGNHLPRLNVNENILRGASNEGFDVPDWRDFWLAHQSNLGGPTPSTNIIPSFHRPELIHYLAQAVGTSTPSNNQLRDLIRLVDASTGRVMSYSNSAILPESVNPQFSPRPDFPRIQDTSSDADIIEYVAQQIIGPWDVDNDFDGVADSVWIDPNLPTVKSPDGRMLKPLAAVLIQDLDGNINVNLHGDRAQANGSGFDSALGLLPPNNPFYVGFNLEGLPVPQGLGFGPADISLRPLRDLGVFNPQAFQTGSNISFFDDRYGIRRTLSEVAPGIPGIDDRTSFLHARDKAWPFAHGAGVGLNASNGAPLGVRSDVYAAFDRYGNLAYQSNLIQGANRTNPLLPAPTEKTNPSTDDAYEFRTLNLSTSDDPFTLLELESVLRKFDQDAASLPSRLKDKFNDISAVRSEITRLLTARSVELRHPNLSAAMTKGDPLGNQVIATTNNPLHPEFQNIYPQLATDNDENLMGMQGLIKMLHEQRYRRRSVPINLATDDPELSIADINLLFGQEFAQGKKLDLNRPFGNGFDNNGNGVIDEPGESEISDGFQIPPVPPAPTNGYFRRGISLLGTSVTRPALGSRQVLARNLYCLAQLIVPREYRFPNMASSVQLNTIEWYRIRARNLAQWAINVVDFRDSDAACTRFEYDILPFGFQSNPAIAQIPNRLPYWAPDNIVLDPMTNGYVIDGTAKRFIGVVWGMEMPELLLTESLSFHDKRIRDTDIDDGLRSTIANPNPAEIMGEDMDQYRFPQGSLILELYAPRTTGLPNSDSIARPELTNAGINGLYVIDPLTGQTRLNLQAADSQRNPVWRVGITDVYRPRPNPPTPNPSINEQYQLANPSPQLAPTTIPSESLATKTLEFNKYPDGVPNNDPDFGNIVAQVGLVDAQIGSGLFDDFATQGAGNTQQFDRMIWFLDQANANARLAVASPSVPDLNEQSAGSKRHQVYFLGPNQPNQTITLRGGEYLTLLPRESTSIGSLSRDPRTNPRTSWVPTLIGTTLSPGDPDTLPIHAPSRQAITLDSERALTTLLSGLSAVDIAHSPWSNTASATASRAVVIATNGPPNVVPNFPIPPIPPGENWSDGFPDGVGLNISMPHPIAGAGYWRDQNVPLKRLNSIDVQPLPARGFANLPPDSWIDLALPLPIPLPAGQGFKDVPFDYAPSTNPVLADSNREMFATGTYTNVRSAVLQRLADPRQDWNAVTNPYLTVDWISLDLTVFNGEAPMGNDDQNDQIMIVEDQITPANGDPISFQSRYKDGGESLIAYMKGDIKEIPALVPPAMPGDPLVNQPDVRTTKSLDPPVPDPAARIDQRWGLSYHSSSTAQLLETPIQSRLVAAMPEYEAYFSVQLGYASQMDSPTVPQRHNSATSIGYANVGYHIGNPNLFGLPASPSAAEFDGFGPPLADANGIYTGYPADLTNPVWLNRPFATNHELMLVPSTSAGTYGISWNLRSIQGDSRHLFTTQPSFLETNPSKVDATSVGPVPAYPDATNPVRRGSWGQYDTRVQGGPTESDMALLFDFVELSSPFSDTVVHHPGVLTNRQALEDFSDPAVPDPRSARLLSVQQRFLGFQPETGQLAGGTLLPPFNNSSTFRAPGKVNLNTVTRLSNNEIPAFRAVEYLYAKVANGTFPETTAQYDDFFFRNRRGYQPATAALFSSASAGSAGLVRGQTYMNPYSPTQFAGAYRPQLSSVFAPDVTRMTTPTTPPPTPPNEDINDLHQNANEQLRSRFSVESGLLRSRDLLPTLPPLPPPPGRNERDLDMPRDTIPAFSPSSALGSNLAIPSAPHADDIERIVSDANRNAFTRYQRMMRLPNLVTDQSNVFAVWVTVSLFEYDPITGFGREYVNASGEEQRERAFYIIDRTVPVGFIPGEDLNTDKTILLRRKISGDR